MIPPKVFSVALDLATAVPTTGRARLVVPYLEAPPFNDSTATAPTPQPVSKPSSLSSTAFPHAYALPLELPLATPTAAWFTVAATYTTADGLSQSAQLDPLFVRFEDLLLPAAPPAADPAAAAARFDELWQLYGQLAGGGDAGEGPPGLGPGTGNGLGPGSEKGLGPGPEKGPGPGNGLGHGQGQGPDTVAAPSSLPFSASASLPSSSPTFTAYESVKHVPLAAVDMKRLVARHFEPFRVPALNRPALTPALSTSTPVTDVCVWAVLPPRHLLMMRFAMTATASVVTFRSDTWRPLAYVDALMDTLVAEAGAS